MKQHKHAELIKAWADGAEIEYKSSIGWIEETHPDWYEDMEYRIKPESFDDIVFYYHEDFINKEVRPYGRTIPAQFYKDALKLVWDGRTKKLKFAEAL